MDRILKCYEFDFGTATTKGMLTQHFSNFFATSGSSTDKFNIV